MEEEILEMQMEPEAAPRQPFQIQPSLARILFLSLAGVAGLALLVAILAVTLAPDGAVTILVVALVVLAVVVLAEIVLLLVARPRNA